MRTTIRTALLSILLGASAAAAQTRWEDKIDLPFVDDPAVLGAWESVDFVQTPDQFRVGQRRFDGDLYLKELIFLENGKTTEGWWTWTKNVLIHHGDKTAARYEIKKLDGQSYMFLEWKSGDYTIRHQKPQYYVLKNRGGLRRDSVDMPFVDDPRALGRWVSADFVATPEQFDPARRSWQGDLFLKELAFLAGGKSSAGHWTWTKGHVLNASAQTNSQYEIRKLAGKEYLFFEWKSGDYSFRNMKPHYYVLVRAGQ